MDFLNFISNLIDSIAWPLTVIATAYILRNSLENLIQPLNKLKYGELEIEFAEEVEAIERSAIEKLPDLQESQSQANTRNEILKLIPISPKAAIIEAWKNLESISIKASEHANIDLHEKSFKKPLYIASALERNGVIDTEAKQLFKKLRELRNEAVHYEKMNLSPEEALSYLNTSLKLANSIEMNARSNLQSVENTY
jgi:hypothetical protein